jgi:hypothetical protein
MVVFSCTFRSILCIGTHLTEVKHEVLMTAAMLVPSSGILRSAVWWIIANILEQIAISSALHFCTEDRGRRFLLNVGNGLPGYTVLHLGRH